MKRQKTAIKPLCAGALLVEFEQRIAPEVLARVLALEGLLREHLPKSASGGLKGIEEMVPAYASLAVFYDRSFWAFAKLRSVVEALLPSLPKAVRHLPKGKKWEIPVCYGGAFGPDLRQMARERGETESQLAKLHSARPYPVYMLGFMPGFVYLGKPDAALHQARRTKPRARVPAGSVAIGGQQTGIYALEGPGGWNIIGRTPLSLFQWKEEGAPSPLRPRDRVQFVAIDAKEFEKQQALWQAGEHPLQKQWYA